MFFFFNQAPTMLVANILGNWTDPGKVTLYSITDCMGQAEQDVTEE